jgi:hypothetical protein
MDLSDKEKRLIKEIPREIGVTWSVLYDKLFLYARRKEQLQVLNMNLEPSHHPLADVINHNKGKISFTWIHPHPFLPFVVLSGGEEGSSYINWGAGRDKVPHPLFSRAKQFSFSPDGKWVVFIKEHNMNEKYTYLMPVSEKYPNYLGSPILLQKTPYGKGDSAWTTSPVSFVGSDVGKLYRWDLGNRDFPEKGKMSFHDYIVQEDLKKLAREKRQGLGEK